MIESVNYVELGICDFCHSKNILQEKELLGKTYKVCSHCIDYYFEDLKCRTLELKK